MYCEEYELYTTYQAWFDEQHKKTKNMKKAIEIYKNYIKNFETFYQSLEENNPDKLI